MKKISKILAAAVLSAVAFSSSYSLSVEAAEVDLTSYNNLMAANNDVTTHPELNYGSNNEIKIGNYDKNMAVTCASGTFVGKDYGDCRIWRGIPFAKPPIGELRWKKPVPVEDGKGIFEAYAFGYKPLQLFDPTNTSEDCLYLNVYKGKEDGVKNKPVMVWIHGGGFAAEAASDDLYRGEKFIKANPDVILVTVEYRLGAMCFMDFSQVPGGDQYKDAVVLGNLDQVAALKWINKNIKNFGGDTKNVTIFGESAGSMSCMTIPMIDESKGLFQKLIAQSGNLSYLFLDSERNWNTTNLMKISGAKNMEDLQKLPTSFFKEHAMDISGGPKTYSIIRNDTYLPRDYEKLYKTWGDKIGNVKVMLGSTGNESRYAFSTWMGLTEDQGGIFFENSYKLIKKNLSPEQITVAEKFLAEYPGKTRLDKLDKLLTQMSFCQGAIEHINVYPNKNKIFLYDFCVPAQTDYAGAYHSVDVEYLFNHKDRLACFGRNDATTHKISDQMQRVWVNFAKSGVPSLNGKAFKPYGKDHNTIVFDNKGNVTDTPHYHDWYNERLVPLRPVARFFGYNIGDLNPEKADPNLDIENYN